MEKEDILDPIKQETTHANSSARSGVNCGVFLGPSIIGLAARLNIYSSTKAKTRMSFWGQILYWLDVH
jgi:hypothetical protein